MNADASGKAALFLTFAALGGGLSLLFELLNTTAKLFRRRKLALAACDILFGAVCLVACASALICCGYEKLEGYMLLGGGCGAVLYFTIISRPCRKMIKNISKKLKKINSTH